MELCGIPVLVSVIMQFNLVVNSSVVGGAEWKESIDTEELMRRCLPSLSDSQIDKYLKEVGKIWEMFEVRSREHSWRVARNHDEIQEFIIKYNLKFKAKLVFGSFMMRGVQEVAANPEVLQWQPFLRFFEWQDLEMKKVKSMRLLKKSGGRYKDFCCRLPWQWNPRDFVIIKSGVLYYSPNREPKEYLPFGSSFHLFKGKAETGYQLGIRLQANHRRLLLYAETALDFFRFIYFIDQTQRQALSESQHRYRSFAPVRTSNSVRFLVDGEDYFRAVAEGIERAQEEIMITGWYISPEFQLVRPVSLYRQKRLDLLLRGAAERGVKVFVLVYSESSFLTNDSAYVKQTLEALSPSIKVLQHPLGVLPTFWSHHQKLVVIDQAEAFMGGLDLGFARYDSSQHLINHNDPDYYPGMEYNNVRSKDLVRVREFWRDGVERNAARLPWHDVGLQLLGESVLDLAHHFIQYWNYASFQTYYRDRYVLVLQKRRAKKPFYSKIGQDIANKFNNIKQFAGQLKKKIFHSEEGREASQGSEPKKVKEDQIRVGVEGSSENQSTRPKKWSKFDESWFDSTSPAQITTLKDESNQSSESEHRLRERQGAKLKRFRSMKELDQIVETMQDQIDPIDFINQLRVTRKKTELQQIAEEAEEEYSCQAVRSVGSWSIGCDPRNKERSVHSAYLDLIRNAKRFIYIENQFFISMTADSASTVRNEIAEEIYRRVSLAVVRQEAFKVWVLLPLIPGFAGELDDPEAVIPRVIMHWQYNTISRSSHSLLSRVAALGVDPSQYIQFLGLRTHGMVAGLPRTEIVYLHSKLIIADDTRALCGSANINERSMRGSRDSEVCLLVEEGPQKKVRNTTGNTFIVSQQIHELRLRLFEEHFGKGLNAADGASEELWTLARQRAIKNTAIYREIFHCYPDDYLRTLADITAQRGSQPNEQLYDELKDKIIGFAVQFPLEFLKDENLLIGATLYPDSLSV